MIARVLTAVGGALVLATAFMHFTGYEAVSSALAASNVSSFFAEGLPVIWLYFSWHLLVISGVLFWVSLSNPGWLFPAVVFCAFVSFSDFCWVYSVAGWFPGTILLLVAAFVLIIVAVLEFPSGHARDA